MNNIYTIIEFDENDKWFVINEIIYNQNEYSYLIKLTNDEKDFIEEYKVVQNIKENGEEYFLEIKDKELLKNIIPLLTNIPKEILENPKKYLNN